VKADRRRVGVFEGTPSVDDSCAVSFRFLDKPKNMTSNLARRYYSITQLITPNPYHSLIFPRHEPESDVAAQ
jgi:hypothetical protein